MSRPALTVANPKLPLVYGYEADNGDTVTFPLNQIQVSGNSDANVHLAEVPGAPGAVDLDGIDEVEQGPLEVELSYMVTESAGTALYSTQSEVEKVTARPGKLWRVLPSGRCQGTRARRLGTPRKVAEVEGLAATPWQNVAMRFTAPAGYWFGEGLGGGGTVLYGQPLYGASLYGYVDNDFVLSGTSCSGTLINEGDAICRALVLKIQAGAAGTIVTPTIANGALNQSLTYAGTVKDADYIELDTAKPSLVQGTTLTDSWASLSLGAGHRQGLLWLEPGPNVITVTSAETMDGTATITFYSPSH
jgi:hypothetical protein